MRHKANYTLVQLQEMPIVGSFYFDEGIFKACDDFIHDPDQSMEDKIGAVNVINKAMGEPQNATEADVKQYIEETQD